MKKKALAIAAMALLLAGCTAPAPEEAPEAPTTAPSTEGSSEETFANELRSAIADYDRASDEQWLEVGNAVCDAYEAGASPNEVIDSMQGSNVSEEEAAAVVVISAEYLCPEFAP